MVKRGDSRVVSSVSLKLVKPYKIGHANHSGPSSSCSKKRINIDLNELPSDSGKEELQSSLSINIDLNELPYDSEREEPQIPPRNLSLLGDCNISKNPPNPKSKPYTSSNKRPLVQERGRRDGYKKAKKLRREALFSSPPPPPEWLLQVMSGMNGAEDARLIYEKTLFATDVNPTQSRLLISFEELIRNDFLTQAEARTSVCCGMRTILMNQRSEQWDLVLKRWVMKKKDSPNEGLSYYALNRGWNNVVNGNGLKAGDNISLWSFRCRGVLFFALFTSPPTLGQSSSSATS